MSYMLGRPALWGSSVVDRVGPIAKRTLIFILIWSAAATAQDDSVLLLSEAVRLAKEDQPQLIALASQEQAAMQAASAEMELADPKLAFGVQNLPVTGNDAFHLDRDDMTMLTIGVMQDVVARRKREAASARMNAEAARLAADRLLNERTIQREAALAWLDVFEAQRSAAILRRIAGEMMAERSVSASQLSSATNSASAVLAIDGELSAIRDELIIAERNEGRARAALSRWIGQNAQRALPESLPHELESAIDLNAVARSLDSHPALDAAEHAVTAALRDVDRARAERVPDWGWQLMYGKRQDDRSDMVSFQVTVGLPINRADRQDRRIGEKLAEANAIRGEKSDRRRRLEAELSSIRADLEASSQRLTEHEQHRIPAASARLETAQAAYAGGGGSLLEVWQARRAWLDASLHHDMILADRARALAQLAWLTGNTEALP